MFTGIIADIGELKNRKTVGGMLVTLKKPSAWTDLELGESISLDGVCLTVDALRLNEIDFRLMAETLDKSTFGDNPPKTVNLERSLKAGDRLGGHFVQGHVDCVGKISKITDNGGRWLDISFPKMYQNLVADKGSIAINGVSLTVAKLGPESLSVSLVDFTVEHTNLGSLEVGDPVNIEFDMIAKHVAQIMKGQN